VSRAAFQPRCSTIILIALLLPAQQVCAQLPPGVATDPATARIVYDDLDRFAAAVGTLANARDTLAVLDSAYLRMASPGLRAYAARYLLDAEALRAALRAQPDRYRRTAGAAPGLVRRNEAAIRQAMTRLQELYPAAVFPPVYHLVAQHRAGGAVQMEGVLIAVETAAGDADDFGALVHLVAHELVHYQQAAWDLDGYQRANSLLARAIKEGVADFIAELISGAHINPEAHAYGLRHEAALWARFGTQMHSTATGDWFFVRPRNPEEPQDLGYFIGYRIARSHFARAQDPAAGVAALIQVRDYEAFLRESGYGGLER
jgi:hypothetical protein